MAEVYLLPMNFENIDDIVKQDKLALVKSNKCCFYPNEPTDSSFFLLIGRYQQVYLKGVSATKSTYKIQGAYIPISKKAFDSIGLQVNLLKFLTYLLVGILVLLILLIVSGTIKNVTLNTPVNLVFISISWLSASIIPFLIVDDLIVYYCKKVVHINRTYYNYGIPYYDLKDYKDLIAKKKITDYFEKKKLILLNF